MSSETTDWERKVSYEVDQTVEPAHGIDEPKAEPTHPGDDHGHGLTDMGYVKVALILAVMTGLEVAISYADLPGGVFMTALMVLMVLKFFTVVSYFMHLKFDNSLFSKLFYSGLLLAIFVFGVVMLTFQVFTPS